MSLRVKALDPYLEELEEGARIRLLQSLHSTAAGRMVDLVSPMVPDGDPDYWRGRFRDELLPRVQSGLEWLDVMEEQQAEKIGAYSYQLPFDERRDSVTQYYSGNDGIHDRALLDIATRHVASLMPTGLKAASIAEVIDEMPKGTNLGWPIFSSDTRYLQRVAEEAELVIENDFDAPLDPAIIFWRGQPRGIGQISKNRTVWGYPHYLTVLELMLQRPALHAIRGMTEFAAWNDFDVIDDTVTACLRSKGWKISNDFTTYDQLLSPALINSAQMVVESMFDASLRDHIQYVFDGIRRIPLITPVGVFIGTHGMPSGSGLTNWVDGLCQWIGWIYVFLKLRLTPVKMTFQGDDGLVVCEEEPDLEAIRGVWQKDFGMILSVDKSMVSEHTCSFLQNGYDLDYTVDGVCRHVRPIMRVLNGMLSYERFHSKERDGWSGYADTMRWIQQVENARWHPKFQELVRFLFGHDKYVRIRTLSEIIDGAGGFSKVERLLKQPSFPYGKEPLSGMASYETVRVLNEYREGRFI